MIFLANSSAGAIDRSRFGFLKIVVRGNHHVSNPFFQADQISQIPALQLLQNLGYTYLTPDEALALRGGRKSAVLLEGILVEQLRKINRIRFKGQMPEGPGLKCLCISYT